MNDIDMMIMSLMRYIANIVMRRRRRLLVRNMTPKCHDVQSERKIVEIFTLLITRC